MYWVRKTRASSLATGNILQHTERLHREVINAIRCGQDCLVGFQLRLMDEELRYEAFLTHMKDELLWFPLVPGETDPPADSLFKPSVDAGYTLHARFRPVLLWIHGQGLAYKLLSDKTKGIYTLLIYWSPETIRPLCEDDTLFKYYLTSRLAVTEEKQLIHFRSVIKNAMDAGQNSASLCILYRGREGYEASVADTVSDRRFVCKTPKHYLTKQPTDEILTINEKYEPILKLIVDTEKLQWTLRIINKETAILTATWI